MRIFRFLRFWVRIDEERGDGMQARTGDVGLLDPFLGEPFGEDVCHGLGWERHWECELGLVSRHGGDVLEKL